MRLKFLCAIFLATGALQAQTPSIASGGIFNVASYVPAGLPSAAIAQGSLFVVFGKAMGPAALTQASALPLATTLAGTSLSVTINGTTTQPFMVYTSATQICALLPSNTPVGAGTMTVTFNGATSTTQPITVASSSVGIFSVNQAGTGPGIITTSSYSVNSLTKAAGAGDVNIIWATGVGAVGSSGSEAAGTARVAALPNTFKVYVGGTSATIVGAARSSSPGLDQIAYTVPAGVTGCHVPVVVQTNNTISNFVSMAIGSGGVCSDPIGTGLTPTQLTLLQQQGSVSLGFIGLDRSTTAGLTISGFTIPGSTTDIADAIFERYTFQQYTASTGGLNVTTYGACSVYFFTGSSATLTDPILPTPLDAGSAITITGPSGIQTLTPSAIANVGIYSGTPGGVSGAPLFLVPGNYLITGPGGKDIGPFSTNITIPPALTWTNAASVTNVNRAAGQLITWTGGDPSGSVSISGSATIASGSSIIAAGFECTAPDSAGQFTIPPVVLLSLPAALTGTTTGSFSSGSLSVGAVSALKNFTATGLDIGYISATASSSQTVTYQ